MTPCTDLKPEPLQTEAEKSKKSDLKEAPAVNPLSNAPAITPLDQPSAEVEPVKQEKPDKEEPHEIQAIEAQSEDKSTVEPENTEKEREKEKDEEKEKEKEKSPEIPSVALPEKSETPVSAPVAVEEKKPAEPVKAPEPKVNEPPKAAEPQPEIAQLTKDPLPPNAAAAAAAVPNPIPHPPNAGNLQRLAIQNSTIFDRTIANSFIFSGIIPQHPNYPTGYPPRSPYHQQQQVIHSDCNSQSIQ